MENREREKITDFDENSFYQLTYWEDIYIDDDFEDDDKLLYSTIDTSLDDFDSSHGGVVTKNTIFQRVPDNKYFCMISTHSYDYFKIESIIEVFPVEKTIVSYE